MQIRKTIGFTLVEVLVIAPIVILLIGTFIGLVVTLTGDSLRLREKNVAAYDVQAALDTMETSVGQATTFLTTTGTLSAPQGKNDDTVAFTNTAASEPDTLIIKSAATTGSPFSSTRSLIYTGTGVCNPNNNIYQYTTVFFVRSGSLYKRTILSASPACAVPWQRASCAEAGLTSHPSLCKAEDEKLLDSVADIDIQYFENAASTTPLATSSAGTAGSVSIHITLSKTIAGSALNYEGTVRANSLNAKSSNGGNAPPNPTITWSRNPSTPYTTTFAWDAMGNATGYNIRYKVGSGAWTNGPQNTTALSYDVVAAHRKQIVDFELKAITSAGTLDYGTSSTTIPRWEACQFQNGWTDYGSPYASAGFTKTSSGVVGLRGLVKDGTVGLATPICTLPPGFRPNQYLVFQVGGYEGGTSGSARIDIGTDGKVMAAIGETNWVSLSGITFLASDSGYTWTDGSWLNGWTNWGGVHANLKYTVDSLGRVQSEGLGRPGTLTTGTKMTAMLQSAALRPSHFMHMPSRSNVASAVSFYADTNGIATRGIGTSYNSMNFMYYPSTFNSWNNLTLLNSWVNYDAVSFSPAQCYKGADDVVVVRGLIKTGGNGVIAELDDAGCGLHADGRLILHGWMNANADSRIDVIANGQLYGLVTNSGWTSIDNIRYIAD